MVDSSLSSNQEGFAFIVAAKELARDGCELGVEDCLSCFDGTVI